MPCKGIEPGLERNIEATLKQTYDNYHVIIVTDTVQDPAYGIAKAVLARHPKTAAHLYTSKGSVTASGKVAALLTALARDAGRADVYAFIDSDALVPPRWLEDLVDPLKEDAVGASTGFRWYFPLDGGFWSYVEAAWNASGSNLLFDHRYNFPWGGAMAARAETLEKIGIKHVWSNALSDDLSLNSALRKNGYRTTFLPQCTVATFNHTSPKRFIKWAIGQTALTRVYNRPLWNYAMMAYAFFDFTFFLGLLSAVIGVSVAPAWFVPSALLLSPSVLGILRGAQRNSTFSRAIPEFKEEFDRTRFRQAVASLVVPWVMVYCIFRSARTREIEWRGRIYKLAGMNSVASP